MRCFINSAAMTNPARHTRSRRSCQPEIPAPCAENFAPFAFNTDSNDATSSQVKRSRTWSGSPSWRRVTGPTPGSALTPRVATTPGEKPSSFASSLLKPDEFILILTLSNLFRTP